MRLKGRAQIGHTHTEKKDMSFLPYKKIQNHIYKLLTNGVVSSLEEEEAREKGRISSSLFVVMMVYDVKSTC